MINTNDEINGGHVNDDEINRKRKYGGYEHDGEENSEDNDFLALRLCVRPPMRPRLNPTEAETAPEQRPSGHLPPQQAMSVQQLLGQPPPMPLRLSPSHPLCMPQQFAVAMAPAEHSRSLPPPPQQVYPAETGALSRPPRGRRNPTQMPRDGKSELVPPPFPWATNRRATVHSMSYLIANEIYTVTGEVQCKRCERQDEIEYDLREKFVEIGTFIAKNKSTMHDRAPSAWMNPVLPSCKMCKHENSLKPVIADKKKAINWLFLLLGQLLGCCTLEQLKYFCKHTKNHRTGAKDRVLYLTYLGLCKQLEPNGPFDR